MISMKEDRELAARIVELLNDLLSLDPAAINMLFRHRVQCNTNTRDHPTVQVLKTKFCDALGILGVLNGLCGVDKEGWGLVTAVYNDDKCTDIERFEVTEPCH